MVLHSSWGLLIMLTASQRKLIYRDMIILALDSRDSVGAQIFSRVREGAYGLESRNLDEVSAFYMEMHDRVQKIVERVREVIQDEIFAFEEELILEAEDGSEDDDKRS